jgi:3-hydroxyacyl-[acyl-carrier-protein] dehydratase
VELNITEILARLPHRPPMLLVDRVLELIPQERIVAIKQVSAGESFVAGHSGCAAPCMPAPLILESMAQSAALFSFAEHGKQARPEESNVVYYFLGVDDATFLRPVVPGDCLRLEVRALRLGSSICKYLGHAYVEDALVAQATLLCAIRTRDAA